MNHDAVLALVSAVWVGLEIVVAFITRGTSRKDRGSFTALWLIVGGATWAGAQLHRRWPMPNREAMFWLGIALIVTGVMIRATAILTLRRHFNVRVTIQDSHELIERGLYRFLRHPSYTGALIAFIGLGFAFGSWLSLAIIVAASMIGFTYRIRVEEQALLGHFGDRYRDYALRTKRLIPGIY